MTLPDLFAAATPGPWYANVDDLVGGFQVANRDVSASGLDPRKGSNDRVVAMFCSEVDARLVALTPEIAPLLIEARDLLDGIRRSADMLVSGDVHLWHSYAIEGVADLLARIDGLTDRSEGSQDVPPVVTSNPAGDPTVRDLGRDEAKS